MSTPNSPSIAINACISCRQRKRKCDKVLPHCGTCTRVGRLCLYDDVSAPISSDVGPSYSSSHLSRSDDGRALPIPGSSPGILFNAPHQVDPFRHDSLRKPTVDVAVSTEASRILGSIENIHRIASKYFITTYTRMPILSKARFYERLPSIYSSPSADFITLCLCLSLVTEIPAQQGQSMQSSVYVMIKSFISLLEATNVTSLDVVQARLLTTLYEVGHGIQPAAIISIGSCARVARAMGLNKKQFQNPTEDRHLKLRAEEEKRVWWGVHNLDRFINMCNADALFATEDQLPSDLLPIDDKNWAEDFVPSTTSLTLSTPSDITVGSFARECQILHLVGRVLRHVYDPTSDPTFHAEESKQLERTLLAFLPLLMEEDRKFGLYCAALGMCSSALFTLYDSAIISRQLDESETARLMTAIEAPSERLVDFSARLFGANEDVNFAKMSPLVPHSLYQSSIIQYRLLKLTNDQRHRENLDSLKSILEKFSTRWLISWKYLEALDAFKTNWPVTIFPLEGFSISARGPTGENSR